MTDVNALNAVLFVCGLSGAGRSTALDALSDQGFYTNENIPVALCESFLSYAQSSANSALNSTGKFSRIALAPDLDGQEQVKLLLQLLDKLGYPNPQIKLLFLDCKRDVILKRYGQTRRPHPGFNHNLDMSLEDAISREREKLFPLRDRANFLIDTSELNLHELRRDINSFVSSLDSNAASKVRVNLVAFGFKYGIPNDCDFVTDVRFLPNPFFVPELMHKSGLDQPVRDFVMERPSTREFLDLSLNNFRFLINQHANSGRLYINIGVGCTGGQHRSVVLASSLAESLKKELPEDKYAVSVRFRDIAKNK